MTALVTPASEEEAADLIRSAATARAPYAVQGGGTRAGLGRPVQAASTLSTGGLTGVTLYEPGALTLVARAGTPLSEIQALLAAEGQHLPFEPMDHRPLYGGGGEPTIGGATAANVSGPRRIQAGACRDSLIGVRFITGEGTIVKNGGRVMKNVTGYDLVKLLAGSHGTLGVLTEVSFKVLPKPEAAATLALPGLSDEAGVAALAAALGSPFDVTGAAHLPAIAGAAAVTMIRLEGLETSVRYRAGALKERLGKALPGAPAIEVVEDAARVAADWARLRDALPVAEGDDAVWRISVRPSRAPRLVAALREALPIERWLYDWGGGLVWLATPEGADAGAGVIRPAAQAAGGHATLMRASDAIRAAVPPFQPEAARLEALSAELRRRFDPSGVLNPGRMAA